MPHTSLDIAPKSRYRTQVSQGCLPRYFVFVPPSKKNTIKVRELKLFIHLEPHTLLEMGMVLLDGATPMERRILPTWPNLHSLGPPHGSHARRTDVPGIVHGQGTGCLVVPGIVHGQGTGCMVHKFDSASR